MQTEIITIGNEILIGQVVDTNSAYLAAELNKLGIDIIQITSIPDMRANIFKALDEATNRADLIILTGGLGPTSDDVTKTALAEYFGSKVTMNAQVLERITGLLAQRGVGMNERNIKQAELPDNCEILNNSSGTAQGMWFRKNGKDIISLPGVPFEMIGIFKDEIEKRLKERYVLPVIHHITLLTHGIAESVMADKISEWEKSLPANMTLAYLPSPGILRLRITGKASGDVNELKQLMALQVEKLSHIIGYAVFGVDDDKLEVIVGNLLKIKSMTLSLAESCTGGMVSSMITSVPGSSAYYKGGVIAYSNEIKTSELNVSPYTLLMNGAVSQPVVEQMADGVRSRFNTDFSVAVSGIAGPDGGTEEKPVGTTWIAVATRKRIFSNVYNFGEDRSRNIQKAAIAALFMLRKALLDS